MFNQLSQMLRKGDTVVFTVARENDTQLRVNVMPKLFTLDGENGADRKALNQPVSIVGTIEELESPAFIEQLNRFTASTNSLRATIDDVEAAHKKAGEEKKKKVEPKPAEKKSGGSKTAARIASKTKPAEPAESEAAAEPEPTPLGL
ncbi:MAG: PRTRC system protein E [Verrucomicrobiota bacterium]